MYAFKLPQSFLKKQNSAFRLKQKPFAPSERNIQQAVISYLSGLGYYVVRMNVAPQYRTYINNQGVKSFYCIRGIPAGFPDLMALKNGKTTFIEVKSIKGRLSPDQIRMHKELEEKGFKVYVIHSIDEAINIFNK